MVNALLPLALREACVRRRGKVLVGPVSIEIADPGATMVLGPNGAGKTTLLRLMHGLERADSGSVSWGIGQERARSAQAFVFQSPIIMRRTVLENLAYPLRLGGLSRASARARAEKQAGCVGLDDALALPALSLSAGEKQKLATARALIGNPDVLFLDEPTANLDGRAKGDIEAILKGAEREGTKIILATHDLGQARRLGRDIVFLCRGKVLERGPVNQFLDAAMTPEGAAFVRGEIVE